MNSSVLQLNDFAPVSSETGEAMVSKEAQALMEYTIRTPKRQRVTRETIVEQFNEVFQLIGGVPRLALWADQNPTQYYQLYSKLLPAAIKAELQLPPDVDGMTPEQLKELSTEQLKALVLIKASELARDSGEIIDG
jgi:hypothetical protein